MTRQEKNEATLKKLWPLWNNRFIDCQEMAVRMGLSWGHLYGIARNAGWPLRKELALKAIVEKYGDDLRRDWLGGVSAAVICDEYGITREILGQARKALGLPDRKAENDRARRLRRLTANPARASRITSVAAR